MSSIKKNIVTLTKARPSVLDNYNDLIAAYWVAFDGVSRISDIPKATPGESIRREFQKLVSLGMIPKPSRIRVREESEKGRGFLHEFESLSF